MIEIPGVASGHEQPRLRGRHQTEFRARTLAENHDAGIKKPPGEGAGVVGDKIPVDRRPRRRARSLQEIEILQEKRHAGEGSVDKSRVDLALGIFVVLHHHRIDLRVDLRGARDRLVEQVAGRDLLLADQIGQADRVLITVFLESHVQVPMASRSNDRPAGFDHT